MEQMLQRINNRLNNIEHTLCYICEKLSLLNSNNSAELALLIKIIKDIEGTQNSLDTANTGIGTANSGISTLSLDVAGVGQGVDDANEAISNINCGNCDLSQVYEKLDEIITAIPQMKCKYKKKGDYDNEEKDKSNKTKKA